MTDALYKYLYEVCTLVPKVMIGYLWVSAPKEIQVPG